MENAIFSFVQDSVASEVTGYGPVRVEVFGTSATAKRASLVESMPMETRLALIGNKTVRESLASIGDQGVITAASRGNFKPFAYQMASLLARNVTIKNAKDFDSVGYLLESLLDTVHGKKNGGYSASGKMTSEHAAIVKLMQVYEACVEAREEQKRADAVRRAAQQQQIEA